MLDHASIEHYATMGHLTADVRLPPNTLGDIRERVEAFLASQTEISRDYFPDLIASDPSWVQFAADPVVLDLVASLIGENIIVWGSALFCKSASGGKATPWHQDAEYWPIRPLETCTVWIAIDESTAENGCLRVVPGTHRTREILAHRHNDDQGLVLSQEIAPQSMPKTAPVDIELEPGMISLHDAFLVHGAEPNHSGKRRAGLTFRYMPSSAYFDRNLAKQQVEDLGVVDISERQLHLVRGDNLETRNVLSALPATLS